MAASLDEVREHWLFGSPIPYAEPSWARGCPSPYFKDSHRRLRKAMRAWVDTVGGRFGMHAEDEAEPF